MPYRTIVVVLGCVVSVLLVSRAYAQWDPSTTPGEFPGSFTDLILNTSGVTQTKQGALTVNGGFGVNVSLCVGYEENCIWVLGTQPGRICWNGDCRGSWQEAGGGNFVHLYPDSDNRPSLPPGDYGFSILTGPNSANSTAQIYAGSDSSFNGSEVYGVFGKASNVTTEFSAGVVGEARADSPVHSAIYGRVEDPGSWAGYFYGNMAIVPQPTGSGGGWIGGDLVVGDTGGDAAAAMTNSVSEVCLNNVCRSNWDMPTSASAWELSGTTLYPKVTNDSLTVGGSDLSSPFRIQYFPLTFLNGKPKADLFVNRDTRLRTLVIGEASSSLSVGTTRGDGVCNGQENNTFGSPKYSPQDCDTVPPGNAVIGDIVIDESSATVSFSWSNPSDVDFAGTRLVMTTGTLPTGPHDSILESGIPKPIAGYEAIGLSRGIQYYFGFYAYDLGGNFASGSVVPVYIPKIRCTPPTCRIEA